jgi:hypothetical protein
MKATTTIALAFLAMLFLSADLLAQQLGTVAYWRHEEGTDGGLIPAGFDTVIDSSGNFNDMRTFDPTFTSATYTSIVSPLALRSGQPNTLALDFGPGGDEDRDRGGFDDDNFTEGKPIQSHIWDEMTVELAFRMNSIGGFQALFGRDGKPLGDAVGEEDHPVPPLKIMVRGDSFPGDVVPNQLFVEWVDGDTTTGADIHFLAGGETIVPDAWYHVAFTLTDTDAELRVAKESGAYELRDALSAQDFAGSQGEVLVIDPTPFTVGRGAFNNGITDWSDAIIDEVRVSDVALTPDQFLFLTADAPAEDADFDDDGDVDGQDFLIWQRGVGATGTGTNMTGDANNDTNVNGDDLAVWRGQFGNPAVAAIPEPATALLLAAAAIGVAASRRRGSVG